MCLAHSRYLKSCLVNGQMNKRCSPANTLFCCLPCWQLCVWLEFVSSTLHGNWVLWRPFQGCAHSLWAVDDEFLRGWHRAQKVRHCERESERAVSAGSGSLTNQMEGWELRKTSIFRFQSSPVSICNRSYSTLLSAWDLVLF